MKRPLRLDRYALPREWPALVPQVLDPSEFVHRAATVTAQLFTDDFDRLHNLARTFEMTAAGVALLALFSHLYGRYPLVKMRRDHSGLFAGLTGEDPSPYFRLSMDQTGLATLAVPRRMLEDLEGFARQQANTVPPLAGAILHAYLMGHPSTPSWENLL
jgi:hypothetical protein